MLTSDTLRVLFLAAEAEPFIKVGGLGDVAGSLPRALRALSQKAAGGAHLDVRLVLPLHPILRSRGLTLRPLTAFALAHRGDLLPVHVYETDLDGMPVYFLDGEPVRASGPVYSSDATLDAGKYAFFSLAALALPAQLAWPVDVWHANDWHAALTLYAARVRGHEAARVLTVHNLPFLGPDVRFLLQEYAVPLLPAPLPEWAASLPLPLGLWAADAIVAVSPTYALEMQAPEYGAGLDAFLRSRADSILGILNGLDVTRYDPASDEGLARRFDADSLPERLHNKLALQERLGLPKAPRTPLLAMVSRMDPQKGVDLAIAALRRLRGCKWQAVILGTGDANLERRARRLARDLPDRVRAEIRYDALLARQIYAGADILLMPSRYEPCGLSQMIAMRYGCVPVVRATGGLKDTVREGETGFLFEAATPTALAAALRRALSAYADAERWRVLQLRGMRQDFSWSRSAREYAALYRRLSGQS